MIVNRGPRSLQRSLTVKKCLINDCTGFEGIAPCCLHCDQREQCPDRCPKSETTFCVGVIEEEEE